MPECRDDLRRHDVVRQRVRRIEVRASPVAIKKALGVKVPTKIPEILIRIVEGRVPASWTHLIHMRWISHRVPDPAHVVPSLWFEIFRLRYPHAAHPDVVRVLAHVAPNGADYLVDVVELGARERLPSIGRIVRIADELFTDFV